MLEGLPELSELSMYGNRVSAIVVPRNKRVLSKLEQLNLGYNDLAQLPDELDQLTALRTLKLMNNFLERVPMRICDMELKTIDVSSNPVIQPPTAICDRGICAMRRYYLCLRKEKQGEHRAMEDIHKKLTKTKKREKMRIKNFFHKSPTASVSPGKVASSLADDNASITTTATTATTTGSGNVKRSETIQSLDGSEMSRPGDMKKPAEPARSKSMNDANKPNPRNDTPAKATSIEDKLLTKPKPQSTVPDDGDLQQDVVQPGNEADNKSDPIVTPKVNSTDVKVTTELDDGHLPTQPEEVTVNDTLKVVFVGMAMAGKTTIIKRLIEGPDAEIP